MEKITFYFFCSNSVDITKNKLNDFLMTHFNQRKHPKEVFSIASLPKTKSGKTKKVELAQFI